MTPHKQLFRHDPDNGVYGDCQRTVYACLLDLQPAEVPHFGELYWDNYEGWDRGVREFLAKHGMARVTIPYRSTLEEVQATMRAQNPGVYYLLSGASGVYDADHVVICMDGEVVHDTSGSGIAGPGSDGLYWVEFLVPLSQCASGATVATVARREALRQFDAGRSAKGSEGGGS